MKHLLITLSLALVCASASAQQADPAQDDTTVQDAQTEAQTPDQDTDSDAPEDIPVDEDSSANPLPPSSRFEPTEQISEDLSVSFPIDI